MSLGPDRARLGGSLPARRTWSLAHLLNLLTHARLCLIRAAIVESNGDFLSFVLIAAAGFSAVSAFGPWGADGIGEQRTVFSRTVQQSKFSAQKKVAAVALQVAFLTSELTQITPLSRLASVVLRVSPTGLLSHLAPIGTMFGIAAAWGQLERVGEMVVRALGLHSGGKNGYSHEAGISPAVSPSVTSLTNESLSKYARADFRGVAGGHGHNQLPHHGRAESYSSISPHESWSSHTSEELSNDTASPTGVVREAKNPGQKTAPAIKTVNAHDAGLERAYLEAMGRGAGVEAKDGHGRIVQDDTIYLFKYDVAGVEDSPEQTDQGCLFVHKKLSPIKTKVADVRVNATYRPLLRTLIQQGKDTRHIPAVRSVAHGEGDARVEGIRMLPCKS